MQDVLSSLLVLSVVGGVSQEKRKLWAVYPWGEERVDGCADWAGCVNVAKPSEMSTQDKLETFLSAELYIEMKKTVEIKSGDMFLSFFWLVGKKVIIMLTKFRVQV